MYEHPVQIQTSRYGWYPTESDQDGHLTVIFRRSEFRPSRPLAYRLLLENKPHVPRLRRLGLEGFAFWYKVSGLYRELCHSSACPAALQCSQVTSPLPVNDSPLFYCPLDPWSFGRCRYRRGPHSRRSTGPERQRRVIAPLGTSRTSRTRFGRDEAGSWAAEREAE